MTAKRIYPVKFPRGNPIKQGEPGLTIISFWV
jgi:hypothetical protein